MDSFMKWSEACAILNQETLTVAEALVTSLCHLRVR
jgi:hypothetical protein